MDRSKSTFRFTDFDERSGIIDFDEIRESEAKQQDVQKEHRFIQRKLTSLLYSAEMCY
jgi:hypothetical protein